MPVNRSGFTGLVRLPEDALSRSGEPGRPPVSKEIRALIRRRSQADTSRDSPRIVGELRKPGIKISKSTPLTLRPPLFTRVAVQQAALNYP
ncbi:MAG: hypothetical protein ABFS24_06030 [Pseudomonadota bacterium]